MISRARFPSLLTRGQLAAVALLLHATAAFSDTYRFGGSLLTFDGTVVTFDNGPTGRDHPADFNVDMAEGLTVRVVVMQGMNPAPDTFHVIPPAGYIAIPDTLTVEEGAQGVIVIALEGLS